ncbi:MAG: peptide chain release factor N(5)-glutamine methyltransferase [Firmicutes bacterium HGW-Firmicutes-11]|jgi:release factor glutamine methyltransferase|nr:MAG: peptide chain release factor N(5)-glutamine methyltransferase [Firmicutes bacterium HGW-Firmicutes-11]
MSMIIKDLLAVAEARFREEGCLDPRLDAELLFLHMRKEDRTYLFIHFGDKLDEKSCDEYFRLVDLRASGVPVQYITGKQEFMGLPFLVNEDVLIPRQDTELLAERAIEEIKTRKDPFGGLRVLDLGTGSGALAISIAHQLPKRKLKLFATDISSKALAVARRNADVNQVSGMIQFIEGDLLSPFPVNRKGKSKKPFDLIISNPPYIASGVIPTLMREVREHEPLLALDGGPDGLDLYIRILNEAHVHLKDDGLLLLEIGYDQGEVMKALVEVAGAYQPAEILQDLTEKDRVAIIRKKTDTL